MPTKPIDYDALANKFGGSDAPAATNGAVDYDALASKFGGVDAPGSNTGQVAAPTAPQPLARTPGNYALETLYGIGRGLKNDAAGLATTVYNPTAALANLYTQTKDALSSASQEYRDNAAAPRGQRLAAATLTGLENAPIVGGMVQHAEQGGTTPLSPESVGAAAEGTTTLEAPGAIGKAARAGVDTARTFRPTSSPSIVPPQEIAARDVAGAIQPPGGVKPQLIRSVSKEMPGIKDYAARTDNPLNTQAELLKAARGYSQEGLDHYNTEILGPLKDIKVKMGPEGTLTRLGDINERIGQINDQLRMSNARSASGGQSLSVMEQSGLEDELSFLRHKLYSNLSERTGVPVEELKYLRESYGGGFSVADSLEAAENARLTRKFSTLERGAATPLDRSGILKQGVQAVRGGEQAIADRTMQKSLAKIPAQPRTLPSPQPMDAAATAAAREAAQREFIRMHESDMAARQAATDRSNVAQGERTSRRTDATASQQSSAQSEFLNQHNLEQSSQDLAAQRNVTANQLRGFNSQLERLKSQEEFLMSHTTEQTAQDLSANRHMQAIILRAINRAKASGQ